VWGESESEEMIRSLLLTILFLQGCLKLIDDPNPTAWQQNYATLEVATSENHFLGVASLLVPTGEVSDTCFVDIYTQGHGTLGLHGCGERRAIVHADWEVIRISCKDLFGDKAEDTETCVLSITDAFRYPEQEKQKVAVHPVVAHVSFFITNPCCLLDIEERVGIHHLQAPESEETSVNILTPFTSGEYLSACGSEQLQGTFTGATFNLTPPKSEFGGCTWFVAVNGDNEGRVGAVFRNVYKRNYVHMGTPRIVIEDDQMIIEADKFSSFIRVNDQLFNNRKVIMEYDASKQYMIRTYSNKGRNTLDVR